MARTLIVLMLFSFGLTSLNADDAVRPRLQCINSSDRSVEIYWIRDDQQRVLNGRLAPGEQATIDTTIGHRFAVIDTSNSTETIVECTLAVQCYRFDPTSIDGIPAFYTQRIDVNGYPIVASDNVNPIALREAAYWIDRMLVNRPDVREAMIRSGSRLCIMGWNEFTTDLPEFAWLAKDPVAEFPGIDPKDYWDARARGLGGSQSDPLCSCGEENLLAYPGDPYSSECILIHEFAHNIHLRGLVNVDPTFDRRLLETYRRAMDAGLWKGKYASVNHHEYFAEGVQSWFDNNRENDHDHNHVNTRTELETYDPGLAAICREVFGDTPLVYTKPTTRLEGHLRGYDPGTAPRFRWPPRLETVTRRIIESAVQRNADSAP